MRTYLPPEDDFKPQPYISINKQVLVDNNVTHCLTFLLDNLQKFEGLSAKDFSIQSILLEGNSDALRPNPLISRSRLDAADQMTSSVSVLDNVQIHEPASEPASDPASEPLPES